MEIEEALNLLNGWWKSGRVKAELAKEYKRLAFGEAYKLLQNYKEIIVLTGLRRVGKSTIIYQIIDELVKKTPPLSVIYFSFDYGAVDIVSILDAYQKITGINWKEEKIYLFVDEIQILDNWASQIKLLYDAFPNIRFVISGSASLQSERKAMSQLVGRYFLVDVPVLSLIEYYSLRHGQAISDAKLYEYELGLELESYLRKPFPALAKIDDQKIIYEYMEESVVYKIISNDLPKGFDRVDITILNALVEIFFREPGMLLNIDSLSRTLAKRKQEIERHIYMLEFSKLIRIVRNYRPSMFSESRKLKKVYPYDISLALAENPSIEKGKVLEALIISRLNVERYWRDGSKEIDALVGKKELIPVEIKSSDALKKDYTRGLDYFISKFKSRYGILLYNGKRSDIGKVKAINVKDILIYGFDDAIKK